MASFEEVRGGLIEANVKSAEVVDALRAARSAVGVAMAAYRHAAGEAPSAKLTSILAWYDDVDQGLVQYLSTVGIIQENTEEVLRSLHS